METHYPVRGDDVEVWLERMRDLHELNTVDGRVRHQAVDDLLSRYRECSDYGLTLRIEDDDKGDP